MAAGAVDCATPLPGTVALTTAAAARVGERRTLALMGERAAGSAHPLAWGELQDDAVPATGSQMKVRFVHASPGLGPVDLGLSGGALYQAQLQGLAFGVLPAVGQPGPSHSAGNLFERGAGNRRGLLDLLPRHRAGNLWVDAVRGELRAAHSSLQPVNALPAPRFVG